MLDAEAESTVDASMFNAAMFNAPPPHPGPGGGCTDEAIPRDLELPITLTGTNDGAGDDWTFCAGADGQDVAFTWAVPQTGSYRFDTRGSTYDTVLTIFAGQCPNEDKILGCNDDSGDLTSLVDLDLKKGQKVTILLDAYSDQVGDYVLNITEL